MKVLYARVPDELYDAVEAARAKDRRSLNMQVQVLLEKALGMENPVKPTGISGEQYSSYEKNTAGATPLPDPADIQASNLEQPCCQHPTRPCKHWVWDSDKGDGYKNTLSGRFREAD